MIGAYLRATSLSALALLCGCASIPDKAAHPPAALTEAQPAAGETVPLDKTVLACDATDDGDELSSVVVPTDHAAPKAGLLQKVWQDHRNYYSLRGLGLVGIGAASGAVIANTDTDEKVYDTFQENVRDANTDEWSEYLHFHKDLGDGLYLLPVYGGAMAVGAYCDSRFGEGPLGEWGERSLRATLVGGPPMLLAQRVTGSSRPGERGDASHWRPLADENGVSGHAYMGAIPFLTAADMTDSLLAKSFFYAGSTLVGLSRLNDGAHYPSQVFLGWWMAFAATRAVDRTERRGITNYEFVPLLPGTGDGAGLQWQW